MDNRRGETINALLEYAAGGEEGINIQKRVWWPFQTSMRPDAQVSLVGTRAFTCGWCARAVTATHGLIGKVDGSSINNAAVYFCPGCGRPNYRENRTEFPQALPGEVVQHLPPTIGALYLEVRRSVSIGAFTAAVTLARTILSHVAVEHGAKEGDSFKRHIEHLDQMRLVPPKARVLLEWIRDSGNATVHDLVISTQDEAGRALYFLGLVLRFAYEVGGAVEKLVPGSPAAAAPKKP